MLVLPCFLLSYHVNIQMCSNVSHRKSTNTTSFSSTPPLVHTPASFSVTIEELNLKEIWQPPYTLLSFSLQPYSSQGVASIFLSCCQILWVFLSTQIIWQHSTKSIPISQNILLLVFWHTLFSVFYLQYWAFLLSLFLFYVFYFFIRFLPLNKYISQFYSQVSFIPVLYVYHVVSPISMTLNITCTLRHNFRNPMLISW